MELSVHGQNTAERSSLSKVLIPRQTYVLNREILAIDVRRQRSEARPVMLRAGTTCTLISCEQFSGKLAAVETEGRTYLLPADALQTRGDKRAAKYERAS
jgi:hypothetical protein